MTRLSEPFCSAGWYPHPGDGYSWWAAQRPLYEGEAGGAPHYWYSDFIQNWGIWTLQAWFNGGDGSGYATQSFDGSGLGYESQSHHVRCVKGGCGVDLSTGTPLHWSTRRNSDTLKWSVADAASYCDQLEYDGRGNWRLPTMSELDRFSRLQVPYCDRWIGTETAWYSDAPGSDGVAYVYSQFGYATMLYGGAAGGYAFCVRE